LDKEKQQTSKNRQKYISTIKIVANQKGQARHLDEKFATMM
jgi:hypothetical protein